MKVNCKGVDYQVEFRHIRQHRLKEVSMITTCVLICDRFVVIENSVCSSLDNFSRPDGRKLALEKIFKYCRALSLEERFELHQAILAMIPERAPKPRPEKIPLSEEEVDILKQRGATKRESRAARREELSRTQTP